jgi:hypothetical protein
MVILRERSDPRISVNVPRFFAYSASTVEPLRMTSESRDFR